MTPPREIGYYIADFGSGCGHCSEADNRGRQAPQTTISPLRRVKSSCGDSTRCGLEHSQHIKVCAQSAHIIHSQHEFLVARRWHRQRWGLGRGMIIAVLKLASAICRSWTIIVRLSAFGRLARTAGGTVRRNRLLHRSDHAIDGRRLVARVRSQSAPSVSASDSHAATMKREMNQPRVLTAAAMAGSMTTQRRMRLILYVDVAAEHWRTRLISRQDSLSARMQALESQMSELTQTVQGCVFADGFMRC